MSTDPPAAPVKQRAPPQHLSTDSPSSSNRDGDCPICYESLSDGSYSVKLGECSHSFHLLCLLTWYLMGSSLLDPGEGIQTPIIIGSTRRYKSYGQDQRAAAAEDMVSVSSCPLCRQCFNGTFLEDASTEPIAPRKLDF